MKRLSRKFLENYGWKGIYVGSSVPSYCERCACQRTHTCTGKNWDEDDWVFDFKCDHCTYQIGSRPQSLELPTKKVCTAQTRRKYADR